VPFRITYGYSKDKRPDLKQFVLSTLCVDRAVPLWGKPEDGNASDKTVNNTVLSNIATFLATHGVAAGAYIYVADAALVTEDNLAALGDTLFITRLPATYNECGRLITEAVAHNAWEEVGVLAHTKPTKHRPVTSYKASEGKVTLYGTPYRAVVVHSSAHRTNGNSSAWNVTSRPRRAHSRPSHALLSSRSISAAPMPKRRRRSSAPCIPPTIWWMSRWRNSPYMAGAGRAPASHARSKPCVTD
jgi:hypothetical protein